MCGRCTLYTVVQEILERFKVKQAEIPFQPSYNIYPSHSVLAVVKDEAGERQLREFIWGLVPPWSPDPTVGIPNARAEGVAVKSSFRGAFPQKALLGRGGRALRMAEEREDQDPMYIRLKSGKPFGFAGLYEV